MRDMAGRRVVVKMNSIFSGTYGSLYVILHSLTSDRDTDEEAQKDRQRNMIAWIAAEPLLSGTEADVLAIFDCCQAGHLCKYRAPIRFEYLGACDANQQTPAPGNESFTQALIWALRELSIEGSFPVSALQQKITQAPGFPKTQRPALAHRFFPSPDHIVLARMEDPASCSNQEIPGPTESDYQPREYLDLRLHFPIPLKDDVLVEAAQAMSFLISEKKIRADCVSYLGRHVASSEPKLMHITTLLVERHAMDKRLREDYARRWLTRTLKQKRSGNPEPTTSDSSTLASAAQMDDPQATSSTSSEAQTTETTEPSSGSNLRRSKRSRRHVGKSKPGGPKKRTRTNS
jgi:hypothetical protein